MGPWYEMPDRHTATCGSRHVINIRDTPDGGIYLVGPRLHKKLLAPFYIDQARRCSGNPPRYDIVLRNYMSGETITVDYADAGAIAKAINARCGYPRAPLKMAIYGLLTAMFWQIGRI